MSIRYTIHESPSASAREGAVHYHPRIDARRNVARIRALQKAMGGKAHPLVRLLPSILMELQEGMLRLFAEGRSVCLPEIGTFTPQLDGTVTLDHDGHPQAHDVHIGGITFRPCAEFLAKAARLTAEPSTAIHISRPNAAVLEKRLRQHFATHATLSRHQLIHDLYHDTITTYRANRLIATLVAEGRLVPVGDKHSPKRCYRLAEE